MTGRHNASILVLNSVSFCPTRSPPSANAPWAPHTSARNLYANGQGVARDFAAAVNWYRKAAEQGDAYGQYSLGLMYYGGQGVPRDYAVAVSWFLRAGSDTSNPKSCVRDEGRGRDCSSNSK
jgi:TPR repeat protein